MGGGAGGGPIGGVDACVSESLTELVDGEPFAAESSGGGDDPRLPPAVAEDDGPDADPPEGERRQESSQLLRSSMAMLIITGVQVGTSALFWLVGSKVRPAEEIGRASGLWFAVQFVNYVATIGLPVTVARYGAHRDRRSDGVVSWAFLLTVSTGLTGGMLCLLYLRLVDSEASGLLSGPFGPLALGAMVAGVSLGMLVDIRLIPARRFDWLLGKTIVIGLVRFPLVVMEPDGIDPGLWQFLVAVGPMVLWGIVGALLVPRLVGCEYHLRPLPAGWREISRYSWVNYLATLAAEAPNFIMPMVVLQSVSAAENANFFVAYTSTGVMFLVPATLSTVVLTEGARHDGQTPRSRAALKLSLAVTTTAFVAAVFGNDLITVVYGEEYAEAARILPWLMASTVPWAYAADCLAGARLRRDHTGTMAITATLGLGVIGTGSVLIPLWGLDGATTAWLTGTLVAAVVAAVVDRREPRVGAPTVPVEPTG